MRLRFDVVGDEDRTPLRSDDACGCHGPLMIGIVGIEQRKDGARVPQDGARIQQRVSTLESEIQTLTNAIASGVPAGPMAEGIAMRNSEKQRLQSELTALDVVPILTQRDREQVRGQLEKLMSDWRNVLIAQTAAARQIVRRLLAQKLRFHPRAAGWGARLANGGRRHGSTSNIWPFFGVCGFRT